MRFFTLIAAFFNALFSGFFSFLSASFFFNEKAEVFGLQVSAGIEKSVSSEKPWHHTMSLLECCWVYVVSFRLGGTVTFSIVFQRDSEEQKTLRRKTVTHTHTAHRIWRAATLELISINMRRLTCQQTSTSFSPPFPCQANLEAKKRYKKTTTAKHKPFI